MTTAKVQAQGTAVAAASSQQLAVSRPVTLPPVLSEARRTDGFRSPMLVVRQLRAGEQVQVQQALVALEARTAPADPNMILWHVGKLLNHWDDRKGDAEKEMIVSDWLEDLSEHSEAHIAEACATWRRTQTYKPKIAEILRLIANIKARDAENARRSRVLLALEAPRSWEKLPPPPEPTVARPNAPGLLAALTSRLTAPAARKNIQPAAPDRAAAKTALDSRDPAAVEKLKTLRPTEKAPA